jgi:hypothetical protein
MSAVPKVVIVAGIKTPHAVETHAALATFHPLGRIGEVEDIVSMP